MDLILEIFDSPAATAIIGFAGGIVAQFLLRYQIAQHEIKKEKIEFRKAQLDNLKQYAERLIVQIMAYDEMANHIIVTLSNAIHDEERLFKLSKKIKKIKDELGPKLQIHFHDLASHQNAYSKAVVDFQDSFFQGIKYEGFKQRGWKPEDIKKMKEQFRELSKQKGLLVSATLDYLKEKESSLFKN